MSLTMTTGSKIRLRAAPDALVGLNHSIGVPDVNSGDVMFDHGSA